MGWKLFETSKRDFFFLPQNTRISEIVNAIWIADSIIPHRNLKNSDLVKIIKHPDSYQSLTACAIIPSHLAGCWEMTNVNTNLGDKLPIYVITLHENISLIDICAYFHWSFNSKMMKMFFFVAYVSMTCVPVWLTLNLAGLFWGGEGSLNRRTGVIDPIVVPLRGSRDTHSAAAQLPTRHRFRRNRFDRKASTASS